MPPTSTERSASPSSLVEIEDEAAFAALSPEDQEVIRGAIEDLNRLVEANPLNAYIPYPKQKAFHSAKERTRAFIGGSRTGKTTCSSADDLIQALPVELVPNHLRPFKKFGHERPFKGRVITPDLGHTMEVVLEKYRSFVPQAALRGGKWEKAFDKVGRILHFARGDRIDFMSTEQHPNKFGGIDLDRVHFDEEPAGPNSWAIYRDCDTRLLDRGGDMLFSMTPLLGTDWVEKEVWDKALDSRDLDHFAIRASMLDNPHLDPQRVAQLLTKLSKEERRAIEHGEFVSFAGKFFDEFDSSVHVIAPLTIEQVRAADDVVVGIDPGKQTAVEWVAFDRDNNATVFAELYPFDETVDVIAEQIRETNKEWGLDNDDPVYVIDPAARAKTGPNAESFEAAYMREGFALRIGQNQRGPTIIEVKRRLQNPPALLITEDCENLIWEVPRYRRDPTVQDEFAAVKRNDHAIDAGLRYAIAERSWYMPEETSFTSQRSNYNPNFQPPYEAPTPPTPPLGVYS